MAWWSGKAPRTVSNVVLFQIDLEGHTTWAKNMESHDEVYRKRRDFADRLETSLRDIKFDRLHWLGDGGLFAREFSSAEDAEAVCDAADRAYKCFADVLGSRDSQLGLRATATWVSGIYTGPVPGYWYSNTMNEFLKYERDIAEPNAFVITEELRKRMSDGSPSFKRFPGKAPDPRLRKTLQNGQTAVVYTDSKHRAVKEPAQRFKLWLARNMGELPKPTRTLQAPQTWIVGDSAILDTAQGLKGYEDIQLQRVELSWDSKVVEPFRDKWNSRLAEAKSLSGSKASAVRIVPPLTDDRALRVEWYETEYSVTTSFHDLVEKDMEVWRRCIDLAESAAASLDVWPFPGNLVSHCLILLAAQNGRKHLLLSHRKKAGRPGGYYKDRWSASFEEQFVPKEGYWGGRKHLPDADIQASVLRGLKEELVGEDFRGTVKVSVHAIQFEVLNLNFGFLASVELPSTDFSEVADRWPSAVDSGEHDCLMALPFEVAVLRQCLKSNRLPENIWNSAEKVGDKSLTTEDHFWHPTSQVRLALGLWLLESGVMKGSPTAQSVRA
ncbi:MAG TPA: hypothetical protein VKL99_13950 [Candidatus Angelobacter sp.]|nr:hypothetical protein [Candidatus Angelobacter sp.]